MNSEHRRFAEVLAERDIDLLFTSSIASTTAGAHHAAYDASTPGTTETGLFERAAMEETPIGEREQDDPADVASRGCEALATGEERVVAGSFKSKAPRKGDDR